MFGIVSLLLCIAYPRPRRYVQKCRLMRCMLVIISITRCPFSYKVSKTHTILSNMKKHENDNLWCLFIKSIESHWPAFLDVSETIIVCPIICTYWLGGRAGRENIWLEVRAYGPSAARSVPPDREPNTQSISILSYDYLLLKLFKILFEPK